MNTLPPVFETPAALRAHVQAARRAGRRVGFVPTMGALHQGHLSLVSRALQECDHVIASVFVNPTQFAPGEDFDAYPRDLQRDLELLAQAECAGVFAPPVSVMYPSGAVTEVRVGGPAEGLEAAARPHFFHGVATVVTKLLTLVAPDAAVFGEKDYQQLLVIRRLVTDLLLPVEIIGAPTVRDADGLAQSSRNAYLTPQARAIAPALHAALTRAAGALRTGEEPAAAEARASAALLAAGFASVDYVAVRDAESLAPPQPGAPLRLLAAARLGGVRLIDNVPV